MPLCGSSLSFLCLLGMMFHSKMSPYTEFMVLGSVGVYPRVQFINLSMILISLILTVEWGLAIV